MRKLLVEFVRESNGRDLIEYALLAATIALAAVTALGFLRDAITTRFESIAGQFGS